MKNLQNYDFACIILLERALFQVFKPHLSENRISDITIFNKTINLKYYASGIIMFEILKQNEIIKNGE